MSGRWQGKDRQGRTFTDWIDQFTSCTTISEAEDMLGTLRGGDIQGRLTDLQQTFRQGMDMLLHRGYTEEQALHDGTRYLVQNWFLIPTDADTQLGR